MKRIAQKKEDFLIKLRQKSQQKKFRRTRLKLMQNNNNMIQSYSNESNKTKILSELKQNYLSTNEQKINISNQIIKRNLFGEAKQFTLIDLQRSQLLDLLTNIFKNRENVYSIEIGWILVNILGMTGINFESFYQKNYFELFYSKLKQKIDIKKTELIEICIYGLSNLCSECKQLQIFLLQEQFVDYFLTHFGSLLLENESIFGVFIWFLSNLLCDINKSDKLEIKYFYKICLFTTEITKTDFIGKRFLENCLVEFSDYIYQLSKIKHCALDIAKSEPLMFKINKLMLSSDEEIQMNAIKTFNNLTEFLEPESYDLMFKPFMVDNYYYLIWNSNVNIITETVFLLSNLVLNLENCSKLLKMENFLASLFGQVVKQNQSKLRVNAYYVLKNIFVNINDNNSRYIDDLELLKIILNGFLIEDIEVIKILIECLKIFLYKTWELDYWNKDDIKEEIIYSSFFQNVEHFQKYIKKQKIDFIYKFLRSVQ